MQRSRSFEITSFLIVYGLGHAIVDASCAYLVMGVIDFKEDFWFNVILYNALAFGLQLPFGYILDKFNKYKITAVVGLLCVLFGYVSFLIPLIAIILAGIGNALFHIGGGQVALNIDNNKTKYAGIFVAPGGIGLALGIYYSTNHSIYFLFPIALLIISIIIFFTKIPYFIIINQLKQKLNYVAIIITVIALSIAIRSLIGFSVTFPWKSNPYLLLALIISIALGKAFGGIFADKFGWIKTGITGLLLSAPLLAFYAYNPLLGIIGIFVFNFTMPITLVAISNLLPNRAGLSFGITTLALFIGAIPTYTNAFEYFKNEWILLSGILVAIILVYYGLREIINNKTN